MLAAEATYNWYYFVDIAEAGNYVAEVRALPGCLSQEKTHKEAIFSQYQTIVAGLKTLKIQGFQYISKLLLANDIMTFFCGDGYFYTLVFAERAYTIKA